MSTYIHPFISARLLCSIYLCIYLSIDLYLSICLSIYYLSIYIFIFHLFSTDNYICVFITVQTPTVEVTNTTVSSGEDAILTCIVATVNNNSEDLTSNIIWSPNTGTAGATLKTNNIFISIYTISNVDDGGIYTCKATLSHTSEYVLRSDSESGDGSVSVTG